MGEVIFPKLDGKGWIYADHENAGGKIQEVHGVVADAWCGLNDRDWFGLYLGFKYEDGMSSGFSLHGVEDMQELLHLAKKDEVKKLKGTPVILFRLGNMCAGFRVNEELVT